MARYCMERQRNIYSKRYAIVLQTEKGQYRFGSALGKVNDDRIVTFWMNCPFKLSRNGLNQCSVLKCILL